MEIDYNNLTQDQLEEYIEFIDWSKVPDRLITKDVIDRFGKLCKGLRENIPFEHFLDSLEIKNKDSYFVTFYRKEDNKKKTCITLDVRRETIYTDLKTEFYLMRSFLKNYPNVDKKDHEREIINYIISLLKKKTKFPNRNFKIDTIFLN